MKKKHQPACCKRCGDEISILERTPFGDNSLCPWCQDMQLEAMQIRIQGLINAKSLISVVNPGLIKQQ